MHFSEGQHLGGGLYYHSDWNNNPRSIRFFFPLEPEDSWMDSAIACCIDCQEEYFTGLVHTCPKRSVVAKMRKEAERVEAVSEAVKRLERTQRSGVRDAAERTPTDAAPARKETTSSARQRLSKRKCNRAPPVEVLPTVNFLSEL